MTTNKGYFRKNGVQSGRGLAPRMDNYTRPTENRVEYQVFSSEYFSAADVKLYFGDIWVDEITSLMFTLQEEVMPIYGYNSYTFDAMARGKRIVQGTFGMNFTSVGYLQEIVSNANAVFYALEQGEKQGIINPANYEDMKLSAILEKLGKPSFEKMAEEYEKAIWGDEADTKDQLSYANRPYFQQDQLGFDIRIQYGAALEATGYVDGKFYQSGKEEAPNLTVDVLNGVQLYSMSKQGISTDFGGAPITEQYGFYARDFNGVSMAQLSRQSGGLSGGAGGAGGQNGSGDTPETIYRKMQYGVIR